MELRSALTEAKTTNGPVVREGLHVVDGSDDIEFTLRVLPVERAAPRPSAACSCCSNRRIGPPGPRVPLAQDEALAANADPRRGLAAAGTRVDQAVPAVHRRRAGSGEPGTARRARGGAVEQRGAAEHQRRARDHEGGTAVGERGTDDGQRAVPEPQPRARRVDRRPVELHQQRGSADGHRRTRSADPPADACGAEGLQPPADRRRAIDLEHIKFSLAVDGIGAIVDRLWRRCSHGNAMSAIAKAAGGCCACCRSAPATIGSTARRSSPWTST